LPRCTSCGTRISIAASPVRCSTRDRLDPGHAGALSAGAKALARLQDPSILAIHFTGDGEGLVYYVMPFVEGESIAERLRRRGPYTADEALKIGEPILQALSHAHTQSLVHRDIKPDNVMVEAKSGRVLLLDFGIAKLLDPRGGEAGGAKTATASRSVPCST